MSTGEDTDRRLVAWGERMFFGMPKARRGGKDPGISAAGRGITPAKVRQHLRSFVAPKAHEVVIKIMAGTKVKGQKAARTPGKGMKAIAAHFRYISRQGKQEVGGKGQTLDVEDESGHVLSGASAIKELTEDWQVAGSYIPEESTRREAFNIVLSMPNGTIPELVRDAAREFARETFPGHKYVFVLHTDGKGEAPHVHLVVRAERSDGVRLNPRKDDLGQWRQRFAQRLQDRGVNAVASRAWTRGQTHASQPIWRLKTESAIRKQRAADRTPESVRRGQEEARRALGEVQEILRGSGSSDDRKLADEVARFAGRTAEQSPKRSGPTLSR